jgi:hypothetical protein
MNRFFILILLASGCAGSSDKGGGPDGAGDASGLAEVDGLGLGDAANRSDGALPADAAVEDGAAEPGDATPLADGTELADWLASPDSAGPEDAQTSPDGESLTDAGDTQAGDGAGSDTADGMDALSDDSGELPPKPLVDKVELKVSPACDLAVRVKCVTTLPTHASMVVQDDAGNVVATIDGAAGFGLDHTLEVRWLKPATGYDLTVTVETEDGTTQAAAPIHYNTKALKAGMPSFAVTQLKPELVAPGFTLLSSFRWGAPAPGGDQLTVVDGEGTIRWHFPSLCEDIHILENGRLLCVQGTYFIQEIDMFDGVKNTWKAASMGVDCFHHAAHPLPGGNILALSTELAQVGGFFDADGKEVTYNLVGDLVVEFQPDGTVVKTWSLLNLMDPHDPPDTSGWNAPTWDLLYPEAEGGTVDWSHGNSLYYEPSDDSIVVSLANLNSIVKLSRSSGSLVWRFGPQGSFTLMSGEWPSHQHAASMYPSAVLRMFDNGSGKKPAVSRAVEYSLKIDEQAPEDWAAWEVWSFTDDEPMLSNVFGHVEVLKNENTLVTFSAGLTYPNQPWENPSNGKFSRIIEVTHTTPPQKVHEMLVPDPAVESGQGFWVMRAKRLVP